MATIGTPLSDASLRRRSVTSKPSSPGMLRSTSTRSGRCAMREANALEAIGGVDHLVTVGREELADEQADCADRPRCAARAPRECIVTLYIRPVNTSFRLPMRLVGLSLLLVSSSMVWACSRLTSPPGPEPIASDTPVTMASAPTVPSAHPTNARGALTALAQASANAPPQVPQGELKIDDLVQRQRRSREERRRRLRALHGHAARRDEVRLVEGSPGSPSRRASPAKSSKVGTTASRA